MGESLTGHLRSEDNTADLLTKVVTGQKGKHLVLLVLYDIFNEDVASNSFPVHAKLFCDIIM